MQASLSAPRSDFLEALQRGFLLGASVLVLVLPPVHWMARPQPPANMSAPSGPAEREALVPIRQADFRGEPASPEARQVAHWAFATGDHGPHNVVIVDKRHAKVFAFDREGRLIAATPALLGSAPGDHTVEGVGDKPLAQVLPEERTTPAGRFMAEPGRNTNGEDVVWVDYAAAVSMHRVRANVAAERRLERLASPETSDNRISYGCINLPVAFYEGVLSPTVRRGGAVVYVLPEVKTVSEVFGTLAPVTAMAGTAAAHR